MSFAAFTKGQRVALTEEFTIALIQAGDFKDIILMLDNPKVTEYLFFAPAPEEVYQGYFGPIIADITQAIADGTASEAPVAIIQDHRGRFMGMAGLSKVMFLVGNYDVGYQLPEHAWGKGVATAACRYMTAYAFQVLGAHKVAADCYASNTGSYKTLEKCGFIVEGRQVSYYRSSEGFDDRLLYGLTQTQYSQSGVAEGVVG